MSVTIYLYRPIGGGELGSGIWSTIAGIIGGVAGPTAQQAGLPGWAVAAIGTGGQVVGGLLNQPPQQGTCLSGRTTSKDEMNRCRLYILGQLDSLRTVVGQSDPVAIVNAANYLVNALSNDGYFKQNGSGDFGRILAATKAEAAAKLAQIQAAIAALTPPAQTPVPTQPGQPGTAAPPNAAVGAFGLPETIFGWPTQTVLAAGAIGLLAWAILK